MKNFKLLILLIGFVLVGCKSDETPSPTSFSGSLTINNQESLDYAINISDIVKDITGDLVITTGGNTGITAASVSAVSQFIRSVGGDVTINTPDGSLSLLQLTSVGGNYRVEGTDANDIFLASVAGDIYLDYDGGYEMPNLAQAGNIDLVPRGGQAAKSAAGGIVSFPLVVASSISTVGDRDGMLDFGSSQITSIALGAGVLVDYIVAPFAATISSQYVGALDNGLYIQAAQATSIEVATTQVNGGINISTNVNTSFVAASLNTVTGDVAITAGSVSIDSVTTIVGNVAVSATTITANSVTSIQGNLILSTQTVSMVSVTTIGGNVEVSGTTEDSTASSADFSSLTSVGGSIEIEAEETTQNTGQPHNSGGNG